MPHVDHRSVAPAVSGPPQRTLRLASGSAPVQRGVCQKIRASNRAPQATCTWFAAQSLDHFPGTRFLPELRAPAPGGAQKVERSESLIHIVNTAASKRHAPPRCSLTLCGPRLSARTRQRHSRPWAGTPAGKKSSGLADQPKHTKDLGTRERKWGWGWGWGRKRCRVLYKYSASLTATLARCKKCMHACAEAFQIRPLSTPTPCAILSRLAEQGQ